MALFGEPTVRREIGGWCVVEKRHAARERLPWHEHPRPYLTIVLLGSYEEDVRGERRRYGDGSIVAHPGGERHADHFPAEDALLVSLERRERSMAALERPWVVDGVRGATATGALLRLLRSPRPEELEIDEEVASLAAGALDGPRGRREPVWIGGLCRLLEASVERTPSLGELAARFDLDPCHMARAFRAARGTTIASYSRRARVDWVRVRLQTGVEDLAALALAAGFCDQSHLNRVFRRHAGTTPARFRRAVRAGRHAGPTLSRQSRPNGGGS